MDEPAPHLVYDFFAHRPLPGYAGNPNHMNGWIKTDVPLLGEMAGRPSNRHGGGLSMLFGDDDSNNDILDDDEDDEEVWEVNKEWLMAPVTLPSMPVMPPPSNYKVGGPCTAATKGHSLALATPGFLVPPSVIEDMCTRMGNLEYGCLLDTYVGSGSRHLEIIMIGCIDLGTKDCNS
uniref:Uncharacterized protein n=1 Tax=Tanacetum cinerariifolium TaxID=118510 RepID=A0A6L2KK64_TANCI|nr:hypothetical protein [Tanacetum cinerariifolium]